MNLKSLIIPGSVLINLFLIYWIYQTHKKISVLDRERSLLYNRMAIVKALNFEEPRYTVERLDCNKLSLSENFGKFEDWSIPITDTEYQAGENYILFVNNSEDSNILRTWNPPGETDPQSFGNSVSSSESEYKLIVKDPKAVRSIMSHINGVKEKCQS